MGRWTQIRLHKKKPSYFETPKASHNLFKTDPFEDFFKKVKTFMTL